MFAVSMLFLNEIFQVSSLYGDPSIGNLIQVTVVKIILIDDPLSEPNLNVTINADTTLKSFCKWQKSLNPENDSDPTHHDVAILVTRKDICARHDYPCNTLGVAHVGGMCKKDKSCSVNEDNGITLAHTITHEMGHKYVRSDHISFGIYFTFATNKNLFAVSECTTTRTKLAVKDELERGCT